LVELDLKLIQFSVDCGKTGCLQLLEILEILEIYWNLIVPPGNLYIIGRLSIIDEYDMQS